MPNATVTVIGNLTGEPKLRFTQGNKCVASFSVAVNEGTKDNPSTSYVDVVTWDTLADNVAGCLGKGDRVIVFGRLHQNTWTQDGVNRSKLELVAESVGPDLRWASASPVKNERRPARQAEFTDPTLVGASVDRIRESLGAKEVYNGEPF